MSDVVVKPVVLDATVLSNFASSRAVDRLPEILDRPAVVPAVQAELERGRGHGHDFLADAVDLLDD